MSTNMTRRLAVLIDSPSHAHDDIRRTRELATQTIEYDGGKTP